MKDTLLTVVCGVAIFFLIISFAISLPIYCRPFYYMQIEPLGLPEQTGESVETIRAAYDEVMDYLTVPGTAFGTGVFKHTKWGATHFADCKHLFQLNLYVLLGSFVTVLTLWILQKKQVVRLKRPFRMHISAVAAASALSLFALLGVCVLIDFDGTFEVFHRVCFPGKLNWAFHPAKDEIIRILPAEYFMSCAILAIGTLLTICLAILIVQAVRRKRMKE